MTSGNFYRDKLWMKEVNMSENRLTNTIRYGTTSYGGQLAAAKCDTLRELRADEMEEMKARQVEAQRLDMACAITDVVETLVKDHNVSVGSAFETAKELASEIKSFVENFKL